MIKILSDESVWTFEYVPYDNDGPSRHTVKAEKIINSEKFAVFGCGDTDLGAMHDAVSKALALER